MGRAAWELAARQHGAVSRAQLLGLGLTAEAVSHRVATRRLHPVARGVYAVGRPELTTLGRWMAAILCCDAVPDPERPRALLSHDSAAALWGLQPSRSGSIDVTVLRKTQRRRPGLRVHRHPGLEDRDLSRARGIPVTGVVLTLVDLAARSSDRLLERLVSEADRLGLVDPERLRSELDRLAGRAGVARLREVLDRRTFRLTDSELERRFLALVAESGVAMPLTGETVNGYRVDFFWPRLGLVVETDGLRYHRTAAQQERDKLRDQAHAAAGLRTLRFTHAQVRFTPGHVIDTLRVVAAQLAA